MSSRRTSAPWLPPGRWPTTILPTRRPPRDGRPRGHLFDKMVTPSDVGKLNWPVIPKQQAEKHFPLELRSHPPAARARASQSGSRQADAPRSCLSRRAGVRTLLEFNLVISAFAIYLIHGDSLR